jgi:predicted dehydrogenase
MRIGARMPAAVRQALEEVFGTGVDDVVLREHSWFARLHPGARATTRRNTIYLRGSLEEFFGDPELVLHEYYHVLRQWNRGRLSQWGYLREWWRRGYWQNRYERQARRFARMRLEAYARALARFGPAA